MQITCLPRKVFLLLLIMACISCKKDEQPIPIAYVDFWLDINLPQYAKLKTPGNMLLLDDNVNGTNNAPNGVLIYRINDVFMAYDNRCTYHQNESVELNIQADNVLITCDQCGSQFVITDGSVTKGPASAPLLQYQTSFDGTIVRVFNSN